MPQPPALVLRRPRVRAGRLLRWLMSILSFALLAYVVFGVARQLIVAPPALRLVLVRDIPLPSGLGATSAGTQDPLAPGVTVQFDRFDFQAYDPATHKLFIAHTGPNPVKLTQVGIPFDRATDGHVVVFDTLQQRVIARVNIPHIAGLAIAADLHKVYASDADDSLVYVFDESALIPTPIHLGDNEIPDAMSYDPADRRIFVSDPGAANITSGIIDRKNQNLFVIDARTDRVIKKINLGTLPKLPEEHAPTSPGTQIPTFGYDVGHNKYDVTQHRVYVTTQILADPNSPNPHILPPQGTGELMAIDPLSAKVIQRVVLPETCETPHGLALDTEQEVAFIACVDVGVTPSLGIFPHLVRVDLRTMQVIPDDPRTMTLAATPDIVLVDSTYDVVFVGCRGGISVFDERPGEFRKLRDYQIAKNTHTIMLDEATQYLYMPVDAGGRPVLRVVQYNPTGV